MRDGFTDPAFWERMAPNLGLDIKRPQAPCIEITTEALTGVSASMARDGYFQLPPLFKAVEIDAIRAGVLALVNAGLPPVFIYMYDEPWALFQRLQPVIGQFLGDQCALLPNFWAWHIPTIEGASGWPKHRDCSAETRFVSRDAGTTLMSLSLWVPLTDATPDNGCMMVLPKELEMAYDPPITDPDQIHQSAGLSLPAQAGSVLGWAQDVYHWSGSVTANAESPRISLSLEFQNPAFSPLAEPLLDAANPPPFAERLALIRAQIPKYRHMESVDTDLKQDAFAIE